MMTQVPPIPGVYSENQDLRFDHISPVYQSFIDNYLKIYDLDPKRFCRPLPFKDEMFFKAILPNYENDASIGCYKFVESVLRHFDAYRQIVDGAFGGFSSLGSVMDFASGWGRLTRVLEQKLRPEQIWVSDIYHEAINWQVQNFCVNGVVSTSHPDALYHDTKHDFVFVGSLFSHLPATLFKAWLAKLYGMLTPRGVLAFSVHDMTILPEGEGMDGSDFRYYRFSESGSLDPDIYGMSYVTEPFVASAIHDLRPDATLSWRRYPKGLYENQDLYVVGAPGRSVEKMNVFSPPMGGFETATLLTNGDVDFTGWAIERTPGFQIKRLVVHVNGRAVLAFTPTSYRPDVLRHFLGAANTPVGWRFRLPRPSTPPGAVVRLHLESGSGLSGYCYTQFPAEHAMTYSGWSRRALRGMK
ncbi:hypothetical protein [Azospirillum largimobile]